MSPGPEPTPTPETQPYWDAAREGRLELPYCTACARHFFYPRPFCPTCSSTAPEWRQVSGRAELASYIVNHRPTPPFDPTTPLVIAIVELAEGPRLVSHLVEVAPDPAAIAVGMPLEVAFAERGEWKVPVFRPAAVAA